MIVPFCEIRPVASVLIEVNDVISVVPEEAKPIEILEFCQA